MIQFLKAIYRSLRGLRKLWYAYYVRSTVASSGKHLLVNNFSRFTSNCHIKDHCSFNGMRVFGYGRVDIGSYFHGGVNCQIITSIHNYMGESLPYDTGNILRPVVIEDCVWFGNNVIVLGGVTIGEGAIIQAGAVVTSNIPKCGIAGGSPAKVFKYRDIEHYDRLKAEGKFLLNG